MEFIIEHIHGESVLWNIIILVILIDLRFFLLRPFALRSFVLRLFALSSFVLCAFVTAPFCPALFWRRSYVDRLLSFALMSLPPGWFLSAHPPPLPIQAPFLPLTAGWREFKIGISTIIPKLSHEVVRSVNKTSSHLEAFIYKQACTNSHPEAAEASIQFKKCRV